MRWLLVLCLVAGTASAQPIPHGGLRQVITDASMTGYGTMISPLKIRTDCATNDGLKWSGTTWVCTGGATVTGSGTANTIPKWTGTSTLSNSALSDTGSVLSYSGTGVSAIQGSLRAGITLGTGNYLAVGRDVTATTDAENGYRMTPFTDGNVYLDSKTFAGGATGFRVGHGTETGFARTWMTVTNSNGNVSTTGSWTLGDAVTDLATVNGRVSVVSSSTLNDQISSQFGAATFKLGIQASIDNNAAASIMHNAYAQRSNTGTPTYKWVSSHASFGSRGIEFDLTDGILFFADAAATTADSTFTPTERVRIANTGLTTIKLGTTTTTAPIAGSVLSLEQADATVNYLTFRGTISKGVVFNNASGAADGYVLYDQAGAGDRGLTFATAGVVRAKINSAGAVFLGDTASSSINNNVDVLTLGNTGTSHTADVRALNIDTTGMTFNTAGPATLNSYGIRVNHVSTESGGGGEFGGTLNDYGIHVITKGADGANHALHVAEGRVHVTEDYTRTTSRELVNVSSTGTITISGSLYTIGYQADIATGRSGGTALTNYGFYSDVRSGDTNYAFYANRGDVRIGGTSGNLQVDTNTTLGNSVTVDTLSLNSKIDTKLYNTGTSPSLSSCGTGPSIVGNDTAGTITTGTGATACTATFSAAFSTNAPVCVLSARGGTDPQYSTSTTALTLSTATASASYDYVCHGRL